MKKLMLLAPVALALAGLVASPALADKASRQAARAERAEKKAERQDRKAENGDHKGKFDKNHDGVMSDNERIARHDARPGWSYRKDLPGMGIDVDHIDFASVGPGAVAVLNVAGGSGSMGGGKGEHNGASSDH